MTDPRMEAFRPFLEDTPEERRAPIVALLERILADYPQLETRLGWGYPIFTHHGTFILGVNNSVPNILISAEFETLEVFRKKFEEAGYKATKMLLQLPFKKEIPYELLRQVIDYNLETKKDHDKFWR